MVDWHSNMASLYSNKYGPRTGSKKPASNFVKCVLFHFENLCQFYEYLLLDTKSFSPAQSSVCAGVCGVCCVHKKLWLVITANCRTRAHKVKKVRVHIQPPTWCDALALLITPARDYPETWKKICIFYQHYIGHHTYVDIQDIFADILNDRPTAENYFTADWWCIFSPFVSSFSRC